MHMEDIKMPKLYKATAESPDIPRNKRDIYWVGSGYDILEIIDPWPAWQNPEKYRKLAEILQNAVQNLEPGILVKLKGLESGRMKQHREIWVISTQ